MTRKGTNNIESDIQISKGFDRDIDYEPIKNKFIKEFDIQLSKYEEKKTDRVCYKLIYLLIAMIQLRNGSRISEAINSLKIFILNGIHCKVVVKIGKSESTKYIYDRKDRTKEPTKYITKPRYRKMMFPISWIKTDKIDKLLSEIRVNYHNFLNDTRMRKRVLDYMARNYNCNTHSLRYAFINYMLYVHKRPLCDIAKFVGHVNINQLIRYTQQKNCDQIFDLDI